MKKLNWSFYKQIRLVHVLLAVFVFWLGRSLAEEDKWSLGIAFITMLAAFPWFLLGLIFIVSNEDRYERIQKRIEQLEKRND